ATPDELPGSISPSWAAASSSGQGGATPDELPGSISPSWAAASSSGNGNATPEEFPGSIKVGGTGGGICVTGSLVVANAGRPAGFAAGVEACRSPSRAAPISACTNPLHV